MRDDCPRTASPPDCLDDNLVAGFVEGALGEAERIRVERLIDQCAVCRRQVSEVMRVRSTLGGSPGLVATAAASPPARLGRYQVRRTLGEGGMGVVVAAWDPQLEREVAIKVVRGGSAEGALRLVREARAMARLRHPAVITVHDAGLVAGQVYVVMELVDGETLAAWFAGEPAWTDALARCRIAGAGLVAAHAAGLVHRDFKPANVLCDRDGRVIVADFGLARGSPGIADAASALTCAGAVVGTPAYMAPEQHLGEAVGPAADQFALAATLYEGLYGLRPFAGTTLAALLAEVLSGQVRPPPATSPVPPAIGAVVRRGLARDPADRFPSVQALLDALDRAGPVTASSPARRLGLAPAAVAAIAASLGVTALVTWKLASGGEPVPASAAAIPPPDATAIASAAPPPDAAVISAPPDFAADRLARWDVLADRGPIDARARAWAPDAILQALTTVGVGPDGVADLAAGAFVQYAYHSPSRGVTDDLPLRGLCGQVMYFQRGSFSQWDTSSTECARQRAPGPPRCGFVEIWRRATADGADPDRPASISYLLMPQATTPIWLFESESLARQYPDDC